MDNMAITSRQDFDWKRGMVTEIMDSIFESLYSWKKGPFFGPFFHLL